MKQSGEINSVQKYNRDEKVKVLVVFQLCTVGMEIQVCADAVLELADGVGSHLQHSFSFRQMICRNSPGSWETCVNSCMKVNLAITAMSCASSCCVECQAKQLVAANLRVRGYSAGRTVAGGTKSSLCPSHSRKEGSSFGHCRHCMKASAA